MLHRRDRFLRDDSLDDTSPRYVESSGPARCGCPRDFRNPDRNHNQPSQTVLRIPPAAAPANNGGRSWFARNDPEWRVIRLPDRMHVEQAPTERQRDMQSIRLSCGNSSMWQIDELRLGKSWQAVNL